ncbi:hypothetical protein [Mesorhizobium sp. IMUNJ 23232]|uniref:hypothetical protein n=1 Tax=Mesorhizobium sp. IMUNJ 23232 TaxID=3376064 RepID=UPI003789892B
MRAWPVCGGARRLAIALDDGKVVSNPVQVPVQRVRETRTETGPDDAARSKDQGFSRDSSATSSAGD